MSTNGWKPRTIETLTCPSGQVVRVRRPGPELMLKAGRVARTFSKPKGEVSQTEEQANANGFDMIANMSDDEMIAFMVFARELVCAMVFSPRLVLNPRPGSDEIGPDDIQDDFWWLFQYGMEGYVGVKVPVGDAEVEISDLASFRGEPGVQGSGVDSTCVPPDAQQPDGDQGLVGSAGV